MSPIWETREAARHLAQQTIARDCPPCPACGAPGEWDTHEVTAFDGVPKFVRGEHAWCVAVCWQDDPQRYLDAVRAVTRPASIRNHDDHGRARAHPDGIDEVALARCGTPTDRRRWWRRRSPR